MYKFFVLFFFLILGGSLSSQHSYTKSIPDSTKSIDIESIFSKSGSGFVLKENSTIKVDALGFNMYGFIAVKIKNKWGIYDTSGKMIVAPKYDSVFPVYSLMKVESFEERYRPYNDSAENKKNYAEYLDWQYSRLNSFDHLFILKTNNQYYEKYEIFSCKNLALASHKYSELYFDWDGKKSGIWMFVKVKDEMGILNPDMSYLIPAQYSSVNFFEVSRSKQTEFADGNYFRVKKNGYYGVYKIGSGEVVKPLYDHLFTWHSSRSGSSRDYLFLDGITTMKKNSKIGLIDSLGNELLKPEYEEIKRGLIPDCPFYVRKDSLFGFYSLEQKQITIPLKFLYTAVEQSSSENYISDERAASDYVNRFNGKYCVITENGKTGVIDQKGEKVIDFVPRTEMFVDKFGYLYSHIDTSNHWELTYVPTKKVLHKKLDNCAPLSEFSLPVFEGIGPMIQDEKVVLLSNEGKIIMKLGTVGCEGPFKVKDKNILKDGEDFYEINSDQSKKKLKIINTTHENELSTGILVEGEKYSGIIILDKDYKMVLNELPSGMKWAKDQSAVKGLDIDIYALVEKDKKIGIYGRYVDSIVVQPVLTGKKKYEPENGELMYLNGKAVCVIGYGDYKMSVLPDNIKWAAKQGTIKDLSVDFAIIEKDGKLGVCNKHSAEIVVEPDFSSLELLSKYLEEHPL